MRSTVALYITVLETPDHTGVGFVGDSRRRASVQQHGLARTTSQACDIQGNGNIYARATKPRSVAALPDRRDVFNPLTKPADVPTTDDLRPQRKERGISPTTAARALGLWPGQMSDLELGRSRDDDLAATYRQWLLTTDGR